MNPINDEMPAKENDLTSVQGLQSLNESSELLNNSSEAINNISTSEKCENNKIEKNQIPDNVNTIKVKEDLLKTLSDNGNLITSKDIYPIAEDNKQEINEANSHNKINHTDFLDCKETDKTLTDNKLMDNDDEKMNSISEDTNKTKNLLSEMTEEEDFEDVEDVEIPREEDVDEIIVPDEAEAEDLTDDKDEHILDQSLNEDEEMEDEEEETRDTDVHENETDASLHEEETTKSSEALEKDDDEDDTDKKVLNNDLEENTSLKDYEEKDMDDNVELVGIEEGNKIIDNNREETKSSNGRLDEDTTSQANYDPLNCTDNQEHDDEDTDKNIENENSIDYKSSCENNDDEITNTNEDEDEDDEVQFVETRNSPICIESDDDDGDSKDTTDTSNSKSKEIITSASKNIIVIRRSARKSTAKPPQRQQQSTGYNSPTTVPQLQNKVKNFSYLQKATNYKRPSVAPSVQHIVDCIELLDSSDEESTPRNKPSQQQQSRTPQKRTLMAAKGNYYKSNSKSPSSAINRLPTNFSPHVRQQLKKPAPPPLPPPTPQSNFLNAVQLQPASVSGPNPPAFSALLSNKNVIIPNAFYGNPPDVRGSPDTELDRRYARWLEHFLGLFCNPRFVATHSCFVFLQRALKYKDFVRIKAIRTNMNSHTHTASNEINIQLMSDLRNIFLKNSKKTNVCGLRFCELTCSAVPGKSVALIAHGITGKVTLKTCSMDLPNLGSNAAASSTSSSNTSTNTLTRKRQLDEDEEEYTPDKSKLKTKAKPSSENGDEDADETSGDGRKRSLRTKRTKRLDNSFSYNEDDLLAEYEIDDEEDAKLAQVEIQRKIEKKRLEAQKQRQQQVKSFESAFIQAFAKSTDRPTTSTYSKNVIAQRIRLKNTTSTTATRVKQYSASNDAEDLLQATWIENVENDDTQIISDDDEPKEHRIYKQQQKQQHQQQQQQQKQQLQQQEHYATTTKLPTRQNASTKVSGKVPKRHQEEIITGDDDDYGENNYFSNSPANVNPLYWPKNVDPQMHVNGKYKDKCVICDLTCQRLVHHYVNEHRGCEVYNSRLSPALLKVLKQGNCTVSNVSLYKNGQYQYEAYCIFCQKQSRFMLPYWYQHFTMHTGEYAYRCTGCGVRKPTRSLLTQHQAQGCPDVAGIVQDYAHDSKSLQIEARICTLCNYVQMHRANIVKHLRLQHNIKQILPKHIQTIVLMKTSASSLSPSTSSSPSPSSVIRRVSFERITQNRPSTSFFSNTYIIDNNENDVTCEEVLPDNVESAQMNSENNYYNYIPPYMQAAVNSGNISFEDVDPGDDLSFMICGMLDVQMNPEAN